LYKIIYIIQNVNSDIDKQTQKDLIMKITLSRLSVASLDWLAGITIEESMTEKYSVAKDHPLLAMLQTEYDRYAEVFDKKAYSGMGKLVAKADVRRNETFVGLKFCIYGLSKVEGSNAQQDAADLYSIIKWHGLDLNRKNYMSKSAILSKLIEELSLPENKLKLERIHLTEVFGLLSAAQDDFDRLALEQMSANAQLRMMESSTALRGNMEKALGNYFRIVTAMKDFDGWTELHELLNESAKSARHSHRNRKEHDEVQPEVKKEE